MTAKRDRHHQEPSQIKVRTIPLWPEAGVALGLSRNGTYSAAARNEIPGLMKFGRVYRVAIEPFERALAGSK